ncbi:protein-L-isoaspartate O-methyltransferase [Methylobacterium nonmethylotrophicum]|uniref:Protein-L-isoaspartate O-methyltransferase n=1 Tax=Methylobacterium nonmethylotrophicum TaxID=1141884 RepID=A0A4Z0NWE0_9HYPH|nr:methyltransferase domain-containing protein [Methylobacterium nonmethylotrophicum]TGE02003.1 protein-L-isoaspartate O-methyltransferase [Methylobacterium nonmethylotrophicum]
MEPEPEDAAGGVEAAAFVLGLRARGVRDAAVLGAMERVPREAFAPLAFRDLARRDIALPLPCGQTMTAPSVIATMLAALSPQGARVLEVGTGSGYATALLVRLGAAEVVSLERYATLARNARSRLDALGFGAATVGLADGCAPPPTAGGFDRILVNGSLRDVPQDLIERLNPGGRLVGALGTPAGPRLVAIAQEADGPWRQVRETPLRISPLTPGLAAIL